MHDWVWTIEWSDGHGWNKRPINVYLRCLCKGHRNQKNINFTIFVCLFSVLLNPYDIEVGCSTVIGKSLTEVTTEYDGTPEKFSI